MEKKEELRRIAFVLNHDSRESIKETLKQFLKTENLIIMFILIVILLSGLYTDIKKKVIIYLLSIFFLILILYRTYKYKKNSLLHRYKVLKGLDWKDKVREVKK